MPRKANKISTRWIRETREAFRDFLDETNFPDPERLGERGPTFKYPEWLIMFIAILSVKLKVKSYVQIHKMAVKYWDIIATDMDLTPISEKQLRDRLKKIRHFPGDPAAFIFQLFPELE
ncbi:hypothetical protein DSCA_12230 [Desulfosarcina alkanivorans]|uniref:H repeat-associated protein N-terminal domain-containing protein n=1 Tax=Desulfosarcina alkanivorans TaxID=571177 RepID=A0A5K7YFE1_9BACT|nr:hypothetical protein [Desulfosarcina alkanivorans]BBO67293.1 hypothetical protein DSCA_12230 [Desulfosarcina alkanivorans]